MRKTTSPTLFFVIFGLLTACGDPLVGNWVGTEICIASECTSLPAEVDGETREIFMTVNEDLTGELIASTTEGTTTEQEKMEVEFTQKGGNLYDMRIAATDDSSYKVPCTLFQGELDCSDDNGGYTLVKE